MKRIGIEGTFLLPAFIVFTLFLVYPVLSSFYYSLTDWNGLSSTAEFVGLDNFYKMFHDQDVWSSLYNTFIIAVLVTVLQNGIGLLLALGLQGTGWIYRILRVWYLLPALLSPLAIGYIWSYMYNPLSGVINTMLEFIGLSGWTQDWLGNSKLAIYSVIFANIWQWVAFSMIIYVAGLQSIPRDMYEASNIDGAGALSRFKNITFPLIAPAFTVNMVVTMIVGLKLFDIIFIMTNGGPGGSTENLALMLYRQAFALNRMGYANAIAILMFVMILIFSLIQVTLLRKREVQY
ncbi:sugar ABC transporter permease [Paenibacillus marchantiophytorum]|uniref:Sugar ABC transporter permease n=1 Tax=Paenibacillus marchantiophytorum TaxID=1619310 RepID=A0ABQ1FJQ4_9BACL|nr:sugar ABC transporter permease [Paenibacillus marchantiophytorum]GGA17088.1 sugar ABC transporter permease [Paenibacillus marchantiophytorum]